MPAPDILHQLVRRIEENLDSYRLGRYNETPQEQEMVRREIESVV